jgi:RimJ/RimL family protein N-acetyltransferase
MRRCSEEVRTLRLKMRRWREGDREPLDAMNADPEVMRYFPQARDRAASDALVDLIEARFQEQGYGLWALERLEDGAFLGFIGLNPMPPDTPGAGRWRSGGAWPGSRGARAMRPKLRSRRSGSASRLRPCHASGR